VQRFIFEDKNEYFGCFSSENSLELKTVKFEESKWENKIGKEVSLAA